MRHGTLAIEAVARLGLPAHIGTYALAVRVDEGAHIAGYALPVSGLLEASDIFSA